MDRKVMYSYLSEFSFPSVQWDETGKNINPVEYERYSAFLDALRLNFIKAVSELPLSEQAHYLNSLIEKKREIIDRGLFDMC